jgi:MFS family permease
MLIADLVAVGAFTTCALATDPILFGAAVLLAGMSNSVFMLARQSYLTEIAPIAYRARALATLGGVVRIGLFVGPFLGAGTVHLWGTPAAFWLALAVAVVTGAIAFAAPDTSPSRQLEAGTPANLRQVFAEGKQMFLTLGMAIVLIGPARGARQVVVPLWGEHLALSPEVTSIVFGISGLLETLVFYPAGVVMDRRGRLWAAIPSMLLLSVGLGALPFATDAFALGVIAAVLGLAYGIGTGMVLTIGGDVVPAQAREQFLSVWRLLSDSGQASGPLIVAAAAAVGSLAVGAVSVAALGVVAAIALGVTVPRWSVHANRRTRLAAGLAPDGKAK